MARSHGRPFVTNRLLEDAATDSDPRSVSESAARHTTKRFINVVCVGTALLLVIVFSVFREIHHNRELYRMSRMVASSEAQARQWQERLRLEEAREASLRAELPVQPFLVRSLQAEKAGHTLPN